MSDEDLRVLHVIPSLSPSHGGPTVALPLLARALALTGVRVSVATTDDDGPGAHLPIPLGEPGVRKKEATYYYFRKQTDFYRFSWSLSRWLSAHIRDFDLVHIHALFAYPSTAAAGLARWQKIPYVVRPLGVLNRWGMENRRRRLKHWSMRFLEEPILRGAARIHYTSEQEQRQACDAGAGSFPSAIIPLGIDTDVYRDLPPPAVFATRFPVTIGRDVVLFLSRLDAKKGLDLLLPAFAEVNRQAPNSLLVIAGDGAPAYVAGLRAQAAKLGLGENKVLWTGFLGGAEKAAALGAADIFVLPSYSENFGIAAAEALAAGLPSVLSDQVAIAEDAYAADAAVVVPCQVPALAAALARLLSEPETRARLGVNARQLVSQKFSLEVTGRHLVQLYRAILSLP